MKTVLITGIGKGIGEALAHKFSASNFNVLGTIFTTSPSPIDNVTTFSLDLSSPESIEECANQINKTGQKIDIVINNAGALFDEDETKVVLDKLRQTLEVNLIGTIDFTERILPLVNRGGHIINISSTAGSLTLTGEKKSHYPGHYPSYKISKAALNMYTATLANRLKNEGITVTSVHPGWVKTDMGGEEADITKEVAAEGIYNIAISSPSTGQFFFGDQKLPW